MNRLFCTELRSLLFYVACETLYIQTRSVVVLFYPFGWRFVLTSSLAISYLWSEVFGCLLQFSEKLLVSQTWFLYTDFVRQALRRVSPHSPARVSSTAISKRVFRKCRRTLPPESLNLYPTAGVQKDE
ncbi:uncharacterized protein LOC143264620 [Megachile rotundata]|uniref:uncharacterized protein LOC143264620 n=1 Tax=Megachile rotundata TaxID=143995 RepID=UPI003FD33F10